MGAPRTTSSFGARRPPTERAPTQCWSGSPLASTPRSWHAACGAASWRAGGVLLLFEGKELRFPSHAADAVRAAVEVSQPFTAAELPGRLDEGGRLVLVRRLVREGFLRFADGLR